MKKKVLICIIVCMIMLVSVVLGVMLIPPANNTTVATTKHLEDNLIEIQTWYNDKMSLVNQNLINYASSVSGISNINVTSSKFRFGEDFGFYECHYTIIFSCIVEGVSCNGEARAFLKYKDTNISWFHFEIYRVSDYKTIVEYYDDSYDKIIEDYYKSLVDPAYTSQGNHTTTSTTTTQTTITTTTSSNGNVTEPNPDENHQNETNNVTWDDCPIDITGGISGSSYSEIIKIKVNNISSKDIDSAKLMFVFTHTNYDNSQQQITGFFTLDTIWASDSISQNISGENYNFLRTSIYPVCIYFKDGTVWGSSGATYEEIIGNSLAFEIKHFALDDENHQDSNTNNDSNSSNNQNNIEDLSYIVNSVCDNYNSGETAYGGKVYATINSSTSITITHNIPNTLSFDEQSNVEEMEDILARLFSEILNEEFPEYIMVYVETSVTYTSTPNINTDSSDKVNNISELQSLVEELCLEYNSDFTYYNGNISVIVNSGTSITIQHIIMDNIDPDDEGVVAWLEEGLIVYFEEAFEAEGFPQKIEVTVKSEYTIAEKPQWISAEELYIYYNLSVYWAGAEIWIWESDNYGTATSSYTLTGSPESVFIENQVYDCVYMENIISVKYLNGILFGYDDLIKAGIISE